MHHHLGLHDVIIMVAQLFHTKDALLSNNSGNHMTSQNPKWPCTGNLKAKISDNLNSIFITLECCFHLVQYNLKFSNDFKQLNVIELVVRVEVPFKICL